MQEFLAVFSHLIAYHDAELAWHLHSIDFIPELFAIPWYILEPDSTSILSIVYILPLCNIVNYIV